MSLWKVLVDGAPRLAVGSPDTGPTDLIDGPLSIDSLLGEGEEFLAYRDRATAPIPPNEVAVPTDSQEVWAAGVTFEESRFAREAESTNPDFYRDVYFADRPELFLKATPGTAVPTGGNIGIRTDSGWDVPEPEVGLVVNARGEIVALTLGNDVSSRSIEGANPLYLPQAKTYDRSCALGPCLVPLDEVEPLVGVTVSMSITRGGVEVFNGQSDLSRLRRTADEMVSWLFRARSFPRGVVLLTGTGIVPDESFTLQEGDRVSITAKGLGKLENTVQTVGKSGSQ